MNTITLITNGQVSFELNHEVSKAEMFRIAGEAGFTGGKTSFLNLLNGKQDVVCGFKIVVQNIVPETAKVVNSGSKVENLKAFKEIHIVEANTETYGTLNVSMGRLQLNPLNNGLFSVLAFPKKGYDNSDFTKVVGGVSKSQYVKLGKLSTQEINAIVNQLS